MNPDRLRIPAVPVPDGQIVYLTTAGKCIRLDTSGKQVRTFESGQNGTSGCVLDFISRGGLLVSRCDQSTAEEFDLEGKSLWRT